MTDPVDGVALPQRVLPVPTSISPQAQAALRSRTGADGRPLALTTWPPADDLTTWTRMSADAHAHGATAAAAIEADAPDRARTLQVGAATLHVATPAGPFPQDAACIDLHGGALVFGGGAECRLEARRQADWLGMRCYGIDYRMPPAHPYPAALDDCLEAYRHVLAHHDPRRIVVVGRSAGGNLAAALMLRARDAGLPLPAGLVLLSPEVDLTESGDSFQLNRLADVVLPDTLMSINRLYAGGADLAHPYLSPLFGDFAPGFPPTFLQTGTRDLFLSNVVRMHRALRRAGMSTELHVFEAMPHGGFGDAPEDAEMAEEVRRFVAQVLHMPSLA